MQLNSDDLKFLCEEAISAAKSAGELIASYAKKHVKVNRKTGGSTFASQVVTEVDLKSQELILGKLEQSIKTYDLALLSEETADDGSRLRKDYFWCIDPLDGTLPFTQQKPGYAVSIALVAKNGVPVIGVVFDPVKEILYHAIKGQGAFCQDQSWELTPVSDVLSFIPATSIKTHFAQKKMLKHLKNTLKSEVRYKLQSLENGGAVMNTITMLEHAPACYIKFPKTKPGGGSFWDYAATTCICAELGAFVSDVHGETLALNRPDTTFMNEKGVIFATNKQLGMLIKEQFQNE